MKGINDFNYDDDFDDAALEDELEAILSGRQPTSTRSTSSNNQSKPKNAATAQTRSTPQVPGVKQNLYDFNLDAMKDLNLNDDEDEIDEDDPELNAQLAAFLGDDAPPSYSPNKQPSNVPPSNNSPNLINLQQPQPIKPTRSAPNQPTDNQHTFNQSSINQSTFNRPIINQQYQTNVNSSSSSNNNCLMLENSHFFGDQNPTLIPEKVIPDQLSEPSVTKEQLLKHKDELKRLALDAKRNNDLDNARAYLKQMKELETVIQNLANNDRPVDPNSITNQRPELSDQETRNLFKAPEPANSLIEALNQRKQKLETTLAKEQAANNTSKVKMMTRLIKQYEQAIKANKTGKPFDYASLPEILGFGELPLDSLSKPTINNQSQVNRPTSSQQGSQQPVPSPVHPPTKSSSITKEQLEALKDEFKGLALDAKRNNDIETAKAYLQKMKEVGLAIESLANGQSIDKLISSISQPVKSKHQTNEEQNTELTDEQSRRLFNVPPPAETLIEALEQRKAKFQATLEKEQAANNTSKVKMISRVLKQYEQAIKASKLGKEFDYDLLPAPPGFGELPVVSSSINKVPNKPTPQERPKQPSSSTVSQPTNEQQSAVTAKAKPPFKRTISVNNKQLDYLLQRQKLFKEAAVESSKKGETTQALDYLRKAKGFTPLIDAVR